MKNESRAFGTVSYFSSIFLRSALLSAFAVVPFSTYAAGGITDFIVQIETILNYIIPFLVGLAVFIIIYGILGYISQSADEERRAQAKSFILWGVIGVFAMLSVWGFVSILVNTFNLDQSSTIAIDRYGTARDASGNIVDPATVLATRPATVIDLITRVNVVGSRIIPFLIGIAVFIIILGILNYVRQGDNEEKRAEGRMFIIWGVVSIFIMLSVWGLVNILIGTFNFDNAVPTIPKLPLLTV